MKYVYFGNELYHHGILGQKQGVRRFQNADGSYKSGAEGRYDPNDSDKVHDTNSSDSPDHHNISKFNKAIKSERSTKKFMRKIDKQLDRERKDMKKWKLKGQYAYTKYKNNKVKPGSREDRKLRKITAKWLAKRDTYYNHLLDSWYYENDIKKKGYNIKSEHDMFS